MKVVEVITPEEFAKYKDDLDSLVRMESDKALFFSYQYLATWLEVFGANSKIFIILTFKDDILTSICPLIEDRVLSLFCFKVPVFKNIGEGLWGYCGVLVHSDYSEEAFSTLIKYLLNRFRYSKIKLCPMSGDSLAVSHLGIVPLEKVKILVYEDAPYIDTSGGIYEYSTQIATKKAAISDAKRCERRLNEMGVLSFNIIASDISKDTFVKHIDVFLELYFSQWENNRFRRDVRFRTFYEDFGYKALQDGMAHFTYLSLDDKVIAFHYGFRLNKTLYYFTPTYNVKYKKYSPGKVLLYYLIQEAFSEKLQFDFMNSLEPYKLDWTRTIRKRVYVELYTNSYLKYFEQCHSFIMGLKPY